MKVAYFTAGNVGVGHLTRGLAIARALHRRAFAGTYRMFGPPLPFAVAQLSDYHPIPIEPYELADPARVAGSRLATALFDYRPDLLLVDMFWAPLRLLRPHLTSPAWLLVRRAPASWLQGTARVPFVRDSYDRVLVIEPTSRPLFAHEMLEPIVVANPEERMPRGSLRSRLGVTEREHLIVAMHAGAPGEIEALAPGGERVFSFDLHSAKDNALFPIAPWLGDADAIYTGAGYNSYWESSWLGHRSRCRFTAFDRSIDDQAWRVRECGSYAMTANGADILADWIMRG